MHLHWFILYICIGLLLYDIGSYGSPKTKRRPRLLFENQSCISKEGSLSCKKSVIKVVLTEDETLPGLC